MGDKLDLIAQMNTAWTADHFLPRVMPDAALSWLVGHLGEEAHQDDTAKRAPIPQSTRHRGNRRPCKFTQRDISRAIRGVEASGKQVGSIRIGMDGSIQIAVAGADDPDEATAIGNEWDVVLRKSRE